MPDLTPQEKVDKVHQTLLDDPVLPQLLNWVVSTATSLSGVEPLTTTELASLFAQIADDAQTGGGVFK